MKIDAKKIRRNQLDSQLNYFRHHSVNPKEGWIKTIREALGMTQAQLAKKMGVSRARIAHIEKREKTHKLSMEVFVKAAKALNCDFQYFLVPKIPFEKMVKMEARKRAENIAAKLNNTMGLEQQQTSKKFLNELTGDIARELEKSPKLWKNSK